MSHAPKLRLVEGEMPPGMEHELQVDGPPDFAGETVPCIRVRPEAPLLSQLQTPAAPPAPLPPPIAPPVPQALAAGGVRF